MKIKLKAPTPGGFDGASTPGPPTPSNSTPGGTIKLKLSQPPTPIAQQPFHFTIDSNDASIVASAPKGKKRVAEDDISPAPKKPAVSRKKRPAQQMVKPEDEITTPLSAGGLAKLKLKKRPSMGPKLTGLFASKGRPIPKRTPGHGYDSEDSEVEEDPAIQQGFILRMQPGEDAVYLREAIANGKMGIPKEEGGADAAIKFLSNDFRRATVRVKSRLYAAVLVDLPCIVESMKSWDKKGWYKVSDINQMLLVLGPCKSEDAARNYELPREVEKNSMRFAHGLTPPMHWVRKRRFRKRIDHRTIANVDEEVERLLEEDRKTENQGGRVEVMDNDVNERENSVDVDAPSEDMDGDEAYETVERDDQDFGDYSEMDGLEANLEEDLEAAFAADLAADSPAGTVDHAAPFAVVESGAIEETPAATPRDELQDPMTQDEQSSDEDESDEDGDSPDAFDEDAAARAAERAQQLEEVADIEREVANVRARAAAMTNQLLKNREVAKLQSLERELALKREAFGLNAED